MAEFFSGLKDDFIQSFVEGDRWLLYLKGIGVTLQVAAMALVLGIILGVLVAVVRTSHDQQRPGKHNPVLGVLNVICQIYTTVIRGTPIMVQLLIMYFVIFASTRNQIGVAMLTFGVNSGAYVSEIIRGGLMAVDPRPDGGRPQPGPELHDHHGGDHHSPGHPCGAACPRQRIHRSAEGYLPDHGHWRQGAAVRRSRAL